jgi:hypothetical protein
VRNALDIIKFHGALEYHRYIYFLTLNYFPTTSCLVFSAATFPMT